MGGAQQHAARGGRASHPPKNGKAAMMATALFSMMIENGNVRTKRVAREHTLSVQRL